MIKLKEIKSWKLITACVFVYIIAGALLPVKHDTEYWTNYWQVMGASLGVLGTVFAVIYELDNQKKTAIKEMAERKDKEEAKYRNKKADDKEKAIEKIQYERHFLILTILNKLKNYKNQEFSAEISNNWCVVLEEIRRSLIIFDDPSCQLDRVFFASLKTQINLLRYKGEHANIHQEELNILKNSFPVYKDVFEFLDDSNSIDRERHLEYHINKVDKLNIESTKDIDVLGHWILNKSYAKRAKYLIGVSTKTKRVVRVFKLADNGVADYNEETGRILFNAEKSLYRDNTREVNESSLVLPELTNWTAMNPVLYFKSYLKKHKELKYSKELSKYIQDYEELGDRDIIVVRTYKFGE